MNEEVLNSLVRIEQSVRTSDGDAILARWDFGHTVIGLRIGKLLPKGLTRTICQLVGISQRELSNRTQIADHYDRELLSSLLLSSSPTWTALVAGLPKRTRQPNAPKPLSTEPTKATVKEADRVAALIQKPDVREELKKRASDERASAKALAEVERIERAEAIAQKRRDTESQRIADTLRKRLVQSGTDWQKVIELLEIMSDNMARLVTLVDGLGIPDDLRMKLVDRQLSKLQQASMTFHNKLIPTYDKPAGSIEHSAIIETNERVDNAR